MASIDEIFQKSGLPSKRKLDPVRDPSEIYKSAKVASNGHSGRRHAHAEEEDQDMADDDDDVEAGPALPPPDDEEQEDEQGDDEEGRFFGGGITAQEKEILNFMDKEDDKIDPNAAPEKIDLAWLKKTALAFEKNITRNAQLRARYEAEPAKFIDSEADLDASIKSLSILSEHPDLYSDFARLGCVGSLVGLLAHDNTDIAIDAAEIIGELTDEDVAATEAQWGALVDALLEADLLGLLVSNFARLDETQEADRSGVYHALGVVENLCSRAETTEAIGKDDALLKWLLTRAQKAEKPVTQNKQYAAEILAILVQSSAANRRRLAGLDAVDVMLQLVAAYRKRDPEKGGDEEEYMENLFEALTCIVDEPEGKAKFIDAEGMELCLIMLREGKASKPASLRLLDHAAAWASTSSSPAAKSSSTPTSNAAAQVCNKIVQAGGLKPIFTLFMKNTTPPKKSTSNEHNNPQTTEHLLGIFSSMIRLLPAQSPERIRTLAKFVEKDYEKTERLVRLRRDYAARVALVDTQISQEKRAAVDDEEREEMADEWFSRRLDAGLFCLQTIDVILAWLVAEDDGARRKIVSLLADRDESLDVLRKTIQEQIDGIGDDLKENDEGRDTRDMLVTLAQFLG
ncbi:Catenin-beta-like protein [Apodospora peruviana]|uniref:Catenin-beta-like protein n=1 Tax=Apodospora peruviana TaxID=516989 RepID=A0AAE0M2N3_9PEZI|nr:Catenin-beta-like protein [Apodospora peruviana]